MDTITLRSMEFFGHTGCLPEEKENGQRFVVSVVMLFDEIRGKVTDKLEDTCDYSKVFDKVKETVENDRSDLIEHLAYKIAGVVLDIAEESKCVVVTVSKPDCPIEGKFETMEVSVTRERE